MYFDVSVLWCVVMCYSMWKQHTTTYLVSFIGMMRNQEFVY